MGLWSFLRGLWPRRRRPRSDEPTLAAPSRLDDELGRSAEPAADTLEPSVVTDHGPAPAAQDAEPSPAAREEHVEQEEQEADEDEGWEDEDEDDLDAPDPFITTAADQLEVLDADLEQRRAEARADALAGEHRIYLSMPAGPGSLAEALNQLSAEGLVEAEFVDDGQGEPHILYRPLSLDARR